MIDISGMIGLARENAQYILYRLSIAFSIVQGKSVEFPFERLKWKFKNPRQRQNFHPTWLCGLIWWSHRWTQVPWNERTNPTSTWHAWRATEWTTSACGCTMESFCIASITRKSYLYPGKRAENRSSSTAGRGTKDSGPPKTPAENENRKKTPKIRKKCVKKFAILPIRAMVWSTPKLSAVRNRNWRRHSWYNFRAHISQLVERILGKDEVFGPIPNAGSILEKAWISRKTGQSMPFLY